MSKKHLILAFLIAFITTGEALKGTELDPWYGNYLEIESRSSLLFQKFNQFATSSHKKRYNSNDFFLREALALSFDKYAAEVELIAACTRKQHFNLDHLKLTARYQVLNDILDDFVSLIAGVSLVEVGKPALFDPASFHHDRFEVEAHLSVGKETSYGDLWQKRLSLNTSLGLSSTYPWLRAVLTYKKNYSDLYLVEFFQETLVGFGHRHLKIDRFNGYGSIQHRSVDLGFRYSASLCGTKALLTAEYSYRVYAKNFPKNTSHVGLKVFYPLGLGI